MVSNEYTEEWRGRIVGVSEGRKNYSRVEVPEYQEWGSGLKKGFQRDGELKVK